MKFKYLTLLQTHSLCQKDEIIWLPTPQPQNGILFEHSHKMESYLGFQWKYVSLRVGPSALVMLLSYTVQY